MNYSRTTIEAFAKLNKAIATTLREMADWFDPTETNHVIGKVVTSMPLDVADRLAFTSPRLFIDRPTLVHMAGSPIDWLLVIPKAKDPSQHVHNFDGLGYCPCGAIGGEYG